MYELGIQFGHALLGRISKEDSITLACTVEDADSLCRGILEILKTAFKVHLVVFWNRRLKTDEKGQISVAPILKEYHEQGYKESNTIIIIKSIISGSCVVRTNLTRLIETSNPYQIFVAAPVLLKGSIDSLEREFDADVSSKFQYLYFAEDATKDEDGLVEPGIGGDVYQRLGFQGQDDKNKYIPNLVKERRLMFSK